MLTTSASPQLAVDAMRAGASDYLVKPVAPDRLMQALRCATTREVPSSELQTLSEKLDATLDFDSMIGANPEFRTSLARAAKAARGHGHILVEGETGTGKDMLVRAVQAASPRAKLPFRIINVRGVAPNSIESVRSEEHTSELQSRENLVCRLLLEKKKKEKEKSNKRRGDRQIEKK